MERYRYNDLPTSQRLAYVLFCLLATGAILYVGQSVLIPIAVAAYLGMLLSIPVFRLQIYGVPKRLAIPVVVGLAAVVLSGAVLAFLAGANSLASDLPIYEQKIRAKFQALKDGLDPAGPVHRLAELVAKAGSDAAGRGGAEKEAFFGSGLLDAMLAIVPTMAHLIAQFGIVMLLVLFFLSYREDLRNRLISVLSPLEIGRATAAIAEAMQRLVRLFATQVVINLSAGAAIGLGLYVMGIPQAAFWGVLMAILRFMPYLGSILAAVFPVLVAAAMGDGWMLALGVLAMILAIEMLFGHMIEPLFFGSMTGLSPLAIVIAAIFWTSMWGAVGLVLAVPLTIAFSILGRYIPGFEFAEKLLGQSRPLGPDLRLYQRLLAEDFLEASVIVDGEAERLGAETFLQDVAAPALARCCETWRDGGLDRTQLENILTHFHALCQAVFGSAKQDGTVLLLHSGQPDDRAASIIFSALLSASGIGHAQASIGYGGSSQALGDVAEAQILCLCFMNAPSATKSAYFARRLASVPAQVDRLSMALETDHNEAGVLNAEIACRRIKARLAVLAEADPAGDSGALPVVASNKKNGESA
ncbi:MAG: hypothetical protein RLZZ444_548 [Pseudomonadota bacterium]